jgi:hypothetical protein
MKLLAAVSLAVIAAAAPGALACAQDAAGPDYQSQVDQYQSQRDVYEGQRQAYDNQQRDYAARRQVYERQLRDYEVARRDYDARYGYGAYERLYPAPVFEEADAGPAYACRDRRAGGAVAGGLLGGLAGSVIGSNIAGRGDRAGGAVLGGLVGGAAGVAIGADASARCDERGYYFAFSDTYPYREGQWEYGHPSGRYDYGWYAAHNCRLAVASGDWEDRGEERYVRVCPDPEGRYRFTE